MVHHKQTNVIMKIIPNKFIPFGNFRAINLFGILFVRGNAKINNVSLNHEEIHTAQMKEMLYIFFYIWYGVEWLIKLFIYHSSIEAYRNISFEREAYGNEDDVIYLEDRKRFAWIKYIK